MTLKEYFEDRSGTGVLATADGEGKVDAAIYSTPHVLDNGTVAFIQALCAGVGFALVGLLGSGLWVLLCFILAVIQFSHIIDFMIIRTAFQDFIKRVLWPLISPFNESLPQTINFLFTMGIFQDIGIP